MTNDPNAAPPPVDAVTMTTEQYRAARRAMDVDLAAATRAYAGAAFMAKLEQKYGKPTPKGD